MKTKEPYGLLTMASVTVLTNHPRGEGEGGKGGKGEGVMHDVNTCTRVEITDINERNLHPMYCV